MRANRLFIEALSGVLLWVALSPAQGLAQQPPLRIRPLSFDPKPQALPFIFQSSRPDNLYLTKLRTDYGLDQVIAGQRSEYDKVRALCKWVRSRWEHNGSNMPEKADALSILEEAKQGKRFRCVEYATVLVAALTAVGITARPLVLLTEDVETRESGAAHVVAEAYLLDQQKWVMIDGQWDAIPTLKGKPLGTIEFQRALAKSASRLRVDSFSDIETGEYLNWIAPYLFYFITPFDRRYGVATGSKELLLVPRGAKAPKVVQRKWPIGDVIYTHSLSAFNAKPPY